jgi:hypothetical protein
MRIKNLYPALLSLALLLAMSVSAGAGPREEGSGGNGQITISGEQIRGKGMDGKLSSEPVFLPGTGKIVGVNSTNGVGFWLECKGNCGKVRKFSEFDNGNYQNWRIPPGKWAVYPNMRQGLDKTNVTITIRY